MRREAQAPEYVFESPDPAKTGIGRFRIMYKGHLTWEQTPEATDHIKLKLAERKLTPVDAPGYRPYYGIATADTGVPGPHRYVHLAVLQHCPLKDEDDPGKTSTSGGYHIFTLEFTAADLKAFETLGISRILRGIAWGISVPPDGVPGDALTGTWQWQGEAEAEVRTADSPDPWSGPDRISFRADGSFEVLMNDGIACGLEIGCIYEASTKALMTGRFVADTGVLVLSPERCEARDWSGDGKFLGSSECDVNRMPHTLRMERAANGRIKFAGLGSVLSRGVVRTWYARKRGGLPPGSSWSGPDPQARPPMGGPVRVCGQVDEIEPNDKAEQATVYTLGTTLTGCRPTRYDDDYFEIKAPAGMGLGYLLGTIRPDPGPGEVEVEAHINVPGGIARPAIRATRSGAPGAPVTIAIPTFPGETYRVHVSSYQGHNPFKYSIRFDYKPVADPYFPNGSRSEAKPISAGTPVQAFAFWGLTAASTDWNSSDWFTIDLQPGTASLTVEDVPANVQFAISVEVPGSSRYAYQSTFTPAGQGRKTSFNVTAGGAHLVHVHTLYSFGARVLSAEGVPPANFTQPYKLLITQP